MQQREQSSGLRKYQGKVLEALEPYGEEIVFLAAENVGEVIKDGETIPSLIKSIPSKERLDALGFECKQLAQSQGE